jgi:hypothetical protein
VVRSRLQRPAGGRDPRAILDAALDEQPSLRQDGPIQQALLALGAGHNALQISGHVDPKVTDFAVGINDAIRPYPVLDTAAFIESTVDAITDRDLARLPRVGAIDQLTHGDDLLINFSGWPADLAGTYRRMLAQTSGS